MTEHAQGDIPVDTILEGKKLLEWEQSFTNSIGTEFVIPASRTNLFVKNDPIIQSEAIPSKSLLLLIQDITLPFL